MKIFNTKMVDFVWYNYWNGYAQMSKLASSDLLIFDKFCQNNLFP